MRGIELTNRGNVQTQSTSTKYTTIRNETGALNILSHCKILVCGCGSITVWTVKTEKTIANVADRSRIFTGDGNFWYSIIFSIFHLSCFNSRNFYDFFFMKTVNAELFPIFWKKNAVFSFPSWTKTTAYFFVVSFCAFLFLYKLNFKLYGLFWRRRNSFKVLSSFVQLSNPAK